jgi:rhamnosyltransferase subunit B
MAAALEWQSRGHVAVIATSEHYRSAIEREGITFAPVRPDLPQRSEQGKLMSQVMDPRRGPEFLLRRLILPAIRKSHADLLEACVGADLIVGHPLTFTVPLVASHLKIPWVYVVLSPMTFLSTYDLPQWTPSSRFKSLRLPGRPFYSLLRESLKWLIWRWFDEIRELSRDVGTYPIMRDPLGADQYSPFLNVALFSSVLSSPQPDWPQNTIVAGFPFYDRPSDEAGIDSALDNFLNSGSPPIVFTLGSAAVMTAGNFYTESAKAAERLGRRAVLLIGRGARNFLPADLPETIYVSEYASYSELFPRAAAIVHHGGIGTTAQVMRAGKPMLIVPFAFDQPDNGRHAVRLRIGRVIGRSHYSIDTAVRELGQLLGNGYAERSQTIGRLIRMENGAKALCDALENTVL